MRPELFKFKKTVECKCQNEKCDYSGHMGHVAQENVGFKTWQLAIILIGMCCVVLPGVLALIVFAAISKQYDIVWCPQCGMFNFVDADKEFPTLLPFAEDALPLVQISKGDRKLFTKKMVKARKKYKL